MILYAHAHLAGALFLLIWGPTGPAQACGAALLAALLVMLACGAGLVIGNRLYQERPPLPSVDELERMLSGQPARADDEESQPDEWPAPFSMTAPESRP